MASFASRRFFVLLLAGQRGGSAEESAESSRDAVVFGEAPAGHKPAERTALLHHFPHALELLHEPADHFDRDAGTFGDTLFAREVHQIRIRAFSLGHREDDRLHPGEVTRVDLVHRAGQLAAAGQEFENALHSAELPDLA